MEPAEKILQQKSVRITPMRQLLLEYFLTKNKIVGLTEMEQAFPRADRITIYRTLKTFVEKGIVHEIENGTSEIKYALCKPRLPGGREHCTELKHIDRHPHFHCLNCGEINCLESVFIPAIYLPEGYFVEEIKMMIKGVCKKCNSGN